MNEPRYNRNDNLSRPQSARNIAYRGGLEDNNSHGHFIQLTRLGEIV